MGSGAKKILEQALALPEDDREQLVAALSDSLSPEPVTLSPEWHAEVKDRIEEIRSGEVEPVSWAEVKADLNKALGRE
jgi:putative addiction module component (TIGR02574 family)